MTGLSFLLLAFLACGNEVSGLVATSASAVQADLLAKVKSATALKDTDFAEAFSATKYGDWYDEESPQHLTGVAKYTVGGCYALDCWMGPSNDIPHSLLCFSECDDGSFSFESDMVTRGATPIGSDPQVIEKYYTPAVAWAAAASSLGPPLPPPPSFNSRLVSSPLRVAVSGLKFEDVERLANEHIDRWCSYVSDCTPIAARLRGSFNARDDKLRQYFYRGKLETMTALHGEDEGRIIAAISTGPISEAYVGGGS